MITGGASGTGFPLPFPFPWGWGAFAGAFLAGLGAAALAPLAGGFACMLGSPRVPDPPFTAATPAGTDPPFLLPPFLCALPFAVGLAFAFDFFDPRPFFFFGAAWQPRQAKRRAPDAATTPTPT